MTNMARGPRTARGALISIDPLAGGPKVISFQYNPATLSRQLQPMMVGGEEGDRSQAVRFTSAPVEQMSVDIELDAADKLEHNDATAVQYGLHPQLAALELLVYPQTSQVILREGLLAVGVIEVAPLSAPTTLFVWGQRRVLPVRILSYSITEDGFDASLNPIRATATISMRVLNYSDLSFTNEGYYLFMAHQLWMESIAAQAVTGRPDNGI